MIVREDMHTHYTQVSFKDEFQNTVVHSKNASWNQIHKETLNAFAFKFPFECILSGRGIQNDRRGWLERERAEAILDKNGQVERQKMAVTHLKKGWASSRGQIVTSIVESFSWSFHIPPVISKVISSFPRTKFVIQVFMFFFF